jgi:hypothetical protein
VGLRSTYALLSGKIVDSTDLLDDDSTLVPSKCTAVVTMTNLQKQSAGNIKAPALAATKLTELPVTLGVAPEDIAGQSGRLTQPRQEPPNP